MRSITVDCWRTVRCERYHWISVTIEKRTRRTMINIQIYRVEEILSLTKDVGFINNVCLVVMTAKIRENIESQNNEENLLGLHG